MSVSSALRAASAIAAAFAALGCAAHDAPGEYFFDDDPGLGAATPLPLATPAPSSLGDISSLAIPLPAGASVSSLNLGLRFRDSSGDWGPTVLRRVYLLTNSGTPGVSLRWGSASAFDATPEADGTITLVRPASLAGDSQADRLLIQPRSGSAQGSPQALRLFPFGQTAPQRLYYALDRRPNPASDTPVELDESFRIAPGPLNLAVGTPSLGFHTLYLEIHDSLGGRGTGLRHLHVLPSKIQNLSGLVYAFKPLPDGATPALNITPIAASSDSQDLSLAVPDTLATGAYSLVLGLNTGGISFASPIASDLGIRSADYWPAYESWAESTISRSGWSQTGPLEDPDQDQLVNLLEYAFGLNPLRKDTSAPYSITVQNLGGAPAYFLVQYRQLEGGLGQPGVDYTAGDLRYTIEGSTDLVTWSPFTSLPGASAFHLSRTSNGDGTETVTTDLDFSQTLITTKRIFIRLNISRAP